MDIEGNHKVVLLLFRLPFPYMAYQRVKQTQHGRLYRSHREVPKRTDEREGRCLFQNIVNNKRTLSFTGVYCGVYIEDAKIVVKIWCFHFLVVPLHTWTKIVHLQGASEPKFLLTPPRALEPRSLKRI